MKIMGKVQAAAALAIFGNGLFILWPSSPVDAAQSGCPDNTIRILVDPVCPIESGQHALCMSQGPTGTFCQLTSTFCAVNPLVEARVTCVWTCPPLKNCVRIN